MPSQGLVADPPSPLWQYALDFSCVDQYELACGRVSQCLEDGREQEAVDGTAAFLQGVSVQGGSGKNPA